MALLQQIPVPLLAVNDTTLTVVEITRRSGEPVRKGDQLMVFETSKTTYEVVAEADGFVEFLCEVDGDYEVGAVVARIFSEAAEVATRQAPAQTGGPEQPVPPASKDIVPAVWEGETLFSQAALQLMEARAIARGAFAGRDFVSARDVEALEADLKKPATSAGNPSGDGPARRQRPVLPADPSRVIIEKLSSGKRREIEYLSEVQSTGLTSTLHTFFETRGIFGHINHSMQYLKNSLLPVICYETSRLLRKYPALNGYFTGEAVAYYREVNLGFAIDIDKGLKVLKLGAADSLSLPEIEQEILRLSNQYLDDKLDIGDLTDITFTITDLSGEGVSFFKPLVNKMNSAILGVSSIDEQLKRCTLSVTFDHRVSEGKMVARFLSDLKGRLESYQSRFHPAVHQEITCFKCFKSLQEDLGDTGFVQCITPQGQESYICKSCLKGF